jgi:hypothetical protein
MWSDETIEAITPYTKVKIIQEKLLWESARQIKQEGKYCPELVTILPSTLYGEIIPGIDASTPFLTQ